MLDDELKSDSDKNDDEDSDAKVAGDMLGELETLMKQPHKSHK